MWLHPPFFWIGLLQFGQFLACFWIQLIEGKSSSDFLTHFWNSSQFTTSWSSPQRKQNSCPHEHRTVANIGTTPSNFTALPQLGDGHQRSCLLHWKKRTIRNKIPPKRRKEGQNLHEIVRDQVVVHHLDFFVLDDAQNDFVGDQGIAFREDAGNFLTFAVVANLRRQIILPAGNAEKVSAVQGRHHLQFFRGDKDQAGFLKNILKRRNFTMIWNSE